MVEHQVKIQQLPVMIIKQTAFYQMTLLRLTLIQQYHVHILKNHDVVA